MGNRWEWKQCLLHCSCSCLIADGSGCGRKNLERVKRDDESSYRRSTENGGELDEKMGVERERDVSPESAA